MVLDCVVFDLDGTLIGVGTGRPVAGVAEILAQLTGAGVELAVATSAPSSAARRVLAENDLARWFTSIAGGTPKDDTVAEALLGLGRPLPDGADRTAVVGDGGGDMAAARRHGLLAVGVTWGRATADLLREAGASVVLDAPSQLLPIVLGPGAGGR